jgi:hypothetical protein
MAEERIPSSEVVIAQTAAKWLFLGIYTEIWVRDVLPLLNNNKTYEFARVAASAPSERKSSGIDNKENSLVSCRSPRTAPGRCLQIRFPALEMSRLDSGL